MTWQRLPAEYRAIAQAVCTDAELDTLALHLAGYTERTISLRLNISRRSVRNRLDNATRKIANHPDMPQEENTA